MSGYIGATPVPQATQHRQAFTATASQTSFATAGYTPQFVDVYLNGVKLAAADYTATNGSDIVLTTGAALDDILEYVAYTPFEVASQTFTGTTTVDVLSVTNAATGTDLTLSGGVYLGGVGAANYLDDYEEGTWTPVVSDASTGGNIAGGFNLGGLYTKVGRLVTVRFNVDNIQTAGMTAGNQLYIQGLPFTVAALTNSVCVGAVEVANIVNATALSAVAFPSQAIVTLAVSSTGNRTYTIVSHLTPAGSDIKFTLTYEAA